MRNRTFWLKLTLEIKVLRHFGKKSMNWKNLETPETLDLIKTLSHEKEVLIFKHSTRCFISKKVKDEFERKVVNSEKDAEFFYLDLLKYRNISNEIASTFDVTHQSPQVIVVKEGRAVANASHFDIVTDIDF